MKVLYISQGIGQDYMRDCLFLGLRELLGPDAVDVNKLDSLYVGADRSQMYGKGFTLYGDLPDIEIDRTDIPKKVAHRFFDLVIYGSIHRNQDYFHEVTSMYPPDMIVYIDGEDHPHFLKGLPGLYFKRELHSSHTGVYPIQFAIPSSKILKSEPLKPRMISPMDPMDKSTYKYNTEEDYYHQYAESRYGITMKKAGYDCLRHYEIMANWCIPYFRVLESCPQSIMTRLPKRELMAVKGIIELVLDPRRMRENQNLLECLYDYLIDPIMENLHENLTTVSMAKYVLGVAHSCK